MQYYGLVPTRPIATGYSDFKKAVRILTKLDHREQCRGAFIQRDILTLPCLYTIKNELHCWFKIKLAQIVGIRQGWGPPFIILSNRILSSQYAKNEQKLRNLHKFDWNNSGLKLCIHELYWWVCESPEEIAVREFVWKKTWV